MHYWLLGLGFAAMYGPTLNSLIHDTWSTDSQGHGPIVLAISLWLFWKNWPQGDAGASTTTNKFLGWVMLALSCLIYAVGRSQSVLVFEAGSVIGVLIGLILILHGTSLLRRVWFPMFFLIFMVPLPPVLVDSITQPMKLAVSYVTELVLDAAGYPIARTGVILQVGRYQLLVADACAGLQTLFTLEAMGLLYLNVVKHSSAFRNIALAILVVPISFTANVIRVCTLVLITYHLGDEAGQGFLHGFAGMVLFMSALLLIITADTLLQASTSRKTGSDVAATGEAAT